MNKTVQQTEEEESTRCAYQISAHHHSAFTDMVSVLKNSFGTIQFNTRFEAQTKCDELNAQRKNTTYSVEPYCEY